MTARDPVMLAAAGQAVAPSSPVSGTKPVQQVIKMRRDHNAWVRQAGCGQLNVVMTG